MDYKELMSSEYVYFNIAARCKKHIFEILSQKAFDIALAKRSTIMNEENESNLSDFDAFSRLIERDKIGSFYLNYNIALPALKFPNYQGEPFVLALKLEEEIEFQSHQKSDLVFCLVFPDNDEVNACEILGYFREFLNQKDLAKQLRASSDVDEFMKVITLFSEKQRKSEQDLEVTEES